MSSPTQRRLGRCVASLWLVAVASVIGSAFSCFLLPARGRLNDLQVFVLGGHEAVHHGALYAHDTVAGYPFTYPPFAALVFAPLSLIDIHEVRVVWLAASAVAAVILFRRAIPGGFSMPGIGASASAALLVGLAAWAVPIRNDFRFGQVEIFLTLLILLDLQLAASNRARGVIIGLTAAVKLTPGLFIVYFLVTRQFRAAITSAAAFVVATAVGALVLPGQSRTYFASVVWNYHRYGVVNSTGNQSITGVLLRFGLDGRALSVVAGLIAVVIAGVALWRARRVGRDDALAIAAIIGCATTLVSPLSWTHHFCWLVLAEIVLLREMRAGSRLLIGCAAGFAAILTCSFLLPLDSFAIASVLVVGFLPTRRPPDAVGQTAAVEFTDSKASHIAA